jgi:hypothetical protein
MSEVDRETACWRFEIYLGVAETGTLLQSMKVSI